MCVASCQGDLRGRSQLINELINGKSVSKYFKKWVMTFALNQWVVNDFQNEKWLLKRVSDRRADRFLMRC